MGAGERWFESTHPETSYQESERCRTRYPILLAHGAGFRDDSQFYRYWGRIPAALVRRGAAVFFGGQDSWGDIEHNAAALRQSILSFLEVNGVEKVNIIAHSKGGLEARYLISKMGMAKHVASLTTISTPHSGSKTIDALYDVPILLFELVGLFVNLFCMVMGDTKPNFHRASKQLSSRECRAFNADVLDQPGVLYQSYGARLRYPFSDPMFLFLNTVLSIIEGDNDGLVTVESSKWGEFKGVIESKTWRGVSHADVVDFWRVNLFGFDIRNVYVEIAEGLKLRGL